MVDTPVYKITGSKWVSDEHNQHVKMISDAIMTAGGQTYDGQGYQEGENNQYLIALRNLKVENQSINYDDITISKKRSIVANPGYPAISLSDIKYTVQVYARFGAFMSGFKAIQGYIPKDGDLVLSNSNATGATDFNTIWQVVTSGDWTRIGKVAVGDLILIEDGEYEFRNHVLQAINTNTAHPTYVNTYNDVAFAQSYFLASLTSPAGETLSSYAQDMLINFKFSQLIDDNLKISIDGLEEITVVDETENEVGYFYYRYLMNSGGYKGSCILKNTLAEFIYVNGTFVIKSGLTSLQNVGEVKYFPFQIDLIDKIFRPCGSYAPDVNEFNFGFKQLFAAGNLPTYKLGDSTYEVAQFPTLGTPPFMLYAYVNFGPSITP